MHKIILLLFILLNLSISNAEELKATIKYNQATAKIEAFKNIKQKIDKEFYKKYLKDKNYKENKKHLESENFYLLNDRYLCPFYYKDKLIAYSVVYTSKPEHTFYYNAIGSLIKFDIKEGEDYPVKVYGYSRFGNLISVSFEINENEQFVYDENGKLTAHWFDKNMNNKDNKIPKIFKITRGFKD